MANFKEFGVGRAVSPMGHDLETHRHIQQYGTEQKDLSFMDISICFVYGLDLQNMQKMEFQRLMLGISSGFNVDYILMTIAHQTEHVVSEFYKFCVILNNNTSPPALQQSVCCVILR